MLGTVSALFGTLREETAAPGAVGIDQIIDFVISGAEAL